MSGHVSPLHEIHAADERWLLSARQFVTRDPVRTLTMLAEFGSAEGDDFDGKGEANPAVEA